MINYDNVLFNIDIDSGDPHPGALLIAEPFLRDEYFRHAVICLIEHSDSSSMGVVLNRAITHTLADLLPDVHCSSPIEVYCGGPVGSDRLYFLHTLGPDILPGAELIAPNLWIGGNFEAMLNYVNSGYPIEGKIRFFIGYSGWDRDQLKGEIEQNVWAVTPATPEMRLLESTGDTLWHKCVRALGSDFRGWLMHPNNPHAN